MTYIECKQIQPQITQLTLNRPDKYNAFDDVFIDEFIAQLETIKAQPDCRALIINANGKHFSAGADLNWMKKMAGYSQAENLNDAKQLAKLMHTLYHFPKPTIALVHGVTFGGGVGLVACCDFVLASGNASFCFSEVKIGLLPAVISPYIIKALGSRLTKRLFLSAEMFHAIDAKQWGLVTEIYSQADLLTEGLALSQQLCQLSPQALSQTKNLLDKLEQPTDPHAIETLTCQAIADIRVSDEGQEGLQAFLDKRTPSWQSSNE